jgi:hypothetical protein
MTPEEVLKALKPAAETDRLNRECLDDAAQTINDIISKAPYNSIDEVKPEDLEFTTYFLVNRHFTEQDAEGTFIVNRHRRLSQIVADIYYPKVNDKAFFHYTKLSALRGILKGQLKLKPLIDNENYDEFKTFYKDHDLIGYSVNTDHTGKLMEQVIMEQSYVMCFASPNGLDEKSEDVLWRSFADNGAGVKIEFEISTDHIDFRKIFYKSSTYNKEDLLINRLNKITMAKYGRIFSVAGISKLGSFYLPGQYKIENEVRFLIKKYTDDYSFELDDSKGYVMLPLKSNYGEFKIKKVFPGRICPSDQLKEVFTSNGLDVKNFL